MLRACTVWPKRIGRRPCDIARDRSGQALIEAALVFPILVGLFLGVSEFSEAFTINRRVEAAANTSADLVARTQSVTNAELAGIKSMVDEMIKPYSTAKLGLINSSVATDQDNTSTIQWSFAQGAGVSAQAVGSVVNLPTGIAEPNTSIVVSEVRYEFSSTLATMIVGVVPMQAHGYFRPRASPLVVKID